jgi:hypothetical protein
MNVPFPSSPAESLGALAAERLLLPEGFAGRRMAIIPEEFETLTPLWDEDPELPLLLPSECVRSRRIDRAWQVDLMVTPSSLGVPIERDQIARAAWAVLSRMPVDEAAVSLASLAVLVERFCWESRALVDLVDQMAPPPAIRNRLLASAQAGEPILNPRAVLWVLRELLAASDDERMAAGQVDPGSGAWVICQAWFPRLRSGDVPGKSEVLLATWLAHEMFHGGARADDGAGGLMSLTTSLAYRFHRPGRWTRELDRWHRVWMTDDDHPAVQDSPISPAELRQRFEEKLGCGISEWFAGAWVACMRWWMGLEPGRVFPMDPTEVASVPLESGRLRPSAALRAALESHMVSNLKDLADAVRQERPRGVDGYGHLPQSDSVACRNAPILETPSGSWVPLSIELVADRATVMHRLLLGARGRPATAVGRMFEAYVADLTDRLTLRHTVITEEELTAAVGASNRRCDGVVGRGTEYLAIEASMQTVSRRIADGEPEAIRAMAARYQDEADQAISTLRDLPETCRMLGLPSPTVSVHLVVTETPVPQSPLFRNVLAELRPDRSPRFVCGVQEFENLVALGEVGWSVPAAVAAWQSGPDDVALDVHLARMAETLRSHDPDPQASVDAWLRRFDSN